MTTLTDRYVWAVLRSIPPAQRADLEPLADRYADRTRALIGPRVYPEWLRLLRILLPIVGIVAGAATAVSNGNRRM